MAYATLDQLAEALRISVTAGNQQTLSDCLDAAAAEIDQVLVDSVPPGEQTPEQQALITRTNVNRAVEWWKAPDTYNGGVGYSDTGTMEAPKTGFERHAAAMLPVRVAWGVG
jgi:hypothetical protein